MDSSKAIFSTHVDGKGRLKEGKEQFDCPKCGGSCYMADGYNTPNGTQHITYKCTDCEEEWTETY